MLLQKRFQSIANFPAKSVEGGVTLWQTFDINFLFGQVCNTVYTIILFEENWTVSPHLQ